MDLNSKIYVAGHRGLVGAAMTTALKNAGYTNVVTRTKAELDLRDQVAVRQLFHSEKPNYVVLAAAQVGGIDANSKYPADFITNNLVIQSNVMTAAFDTGVKRLLYFGSNCAYPRESPQPMREEYLHTGYLEPTNESFAVAKLAGMAMCDAYNRQYGSQYIAVIPAGLYGPHDNFTGNDSHVIPAIMRRLYEAYQRDADSVDVWGTGKPEREFLYVDDLAEACLLLLNLGNDDLAKVLSEHKSVINIATGRPVTIRQLAEAIREIVAPGIRLNFDTSKPDGFPRKVLDPSRMAKYGWTSTVALEEGLQRTFAWFKKALGTESARVG